MEYRGDDFGTLEEAKIRKMWGLCAGSFVYEGCGLPLKDGRPCSLGKHKRKLRRENPESPLGPHSRGRDNHTCCVDGAGVYMYRFAIQVGNFVIEVNKDNGKQLMGLSAQAYKKSCDIDEEEMIRINAQAMTSLWTITYVKDGSRGYRALNFEKCTLEDEVSGSDVVEAGSSEVESKPKAHSDAQWFGKLKGRVLDYSGGIADSLRSFSIKE
ncbi:unnamed protein product [Calypogeia fissa]